MATLKMTFSKALLIAAALLFGLEAYAGDYEKKTYTGKDGSVLLYRQLSPESSKGGKYPLILFLHGAGERGNDNEAQLTHGSGIFQNPANEEKYPAYVLFPQCPAGTTWAFDEQKSWSLGPDEIPADEPEAKMMTLLIGLVKDFIASHPDVNPRKVYVMGLSMGGIATYDITSRYPEVFAAAVPICGAVNPAKVKKAAGVKFSIYHGDHDSVVPVACSREAYKALKAAGAKVRYKEFAGCDHGSWNPAFNEPDFMPWLFKQHK